MQQTIKKPLAFGRVKEVTETEEAVLMPLSPLDHRATYFFATIIYDLMKLGYEKKDFNHFFKDFLKDNSIKTILNHIQNNGRMVWANIEPLKSKEKIIKV